MTNPIIEVTNGQFGYGHRVAASVDALAITPGEVVALLGPNGSGKTTLMKGVLGLVDRIEGDVRVFGRPVEQVRDRSSIGYLPQRQTAAGPIPVTVQELVRSGRLTRRRLLHGPLKYRGHSADAAATAAAIETVGLTALTRRPVAELSGGQQRRALFARALAGGAGLLLLDEPFAGVDQANQEAIADALAVLIDGGVTVVVVLHELGPLEPIVTRAICMDNGRILFDGPIASAPPRLLHLGHDHDPHGGPDPRHGIGLVG